MAQPNTSTDIELPPFVSRTRGVCGGRTCFFGTRMPVDVICGLYSEGLYAEEISAMYLNLTRKQIEWAISCCKPG